MHSRVNFSLCGLVDHTLIAILSGPGFDPQQRELPFDFRPRLLAQKEAFGLVMAKFYYDKVPISAQERIP